MDNDALYRELVLQVRAGDRAARDRLAACVQGRLQAYVYRITLRDDLTQDIVQESMLEMLKILGRLNDADRFWPWLCKIAMNKIRNHYRVQERRKRAVMSRADLERSLGGSQDGLEHLVTEEFKQIVRSTMNLLQPKHRAVLSMRCYEGMSYAQIAEVLDSTELNVRLMFYRGKRQLQKHLGRHGLGSGAVLSALVVFGKMTAPDAAAAAGVTVPASAVKVGAVAATIGALSTKTAVVSLAAAGVIAAGAIVASGPGGGGDAAGVLDGNGGTPNVVLRADADGGACERWYFFPEGADGPVMSRVVLTDEAGRSACQWLENDGGNYRYDVRGGRVHLTAGRSYNTDLSVRRLPTDGAELTTFLDRVEGRPAGVGPVADRSRNLLVIAGGAGAEGVRLVRNYDVLQEEHFRYNWPDGAVKVDERGAIGVQGYCWFTVAGEIGGRRVEGGGFLPLYYGVSKGRPAWVSVRVGGVRLHDDGAAAVLDGGGNVSRVFAGGTFLKGLGRPWMGLHAVDTVRRDAAACGVAFETLRVEGGEQAEVVLKAGAEEVVYGIDLGEDRVESIVVRPAGGGAETGRLDFAYFENAEALGADMVRPAVGGGARESLDGLWLVELLQGGLLR